MTENFPKDEFDLIPAAPGVRRAKRSGSAKALEFITYFGVSAVVAGGSLFGYQTFFGGSGFNLNSVSDNKTTSDPIRINETTVFDGAGKEGLASSVAHKLIDKGWNVVTAANVPGGVAVGKTVIYINSNQLQNAAKTLAGDLGNYAIEVSNQYIDPITVVLGSDYK